MPWIYTTPVLDSSVRDLCRTPYHGHRHGGANYGKRNTCPPQARLLRDILDFAKSIIVVWNVFDLGVHVERMRRRHPTWSDRQLYCCLYWQGTARKQLRREIIACGRALRRGFKIIRCPEACGVNVTATMAEAGEKLQWPPVDKAYQVALLGTERKTR